MSTVPTYEVYGLRLASADRPARDNFRVPGERSGTMRLDFIAWLVCGEGVTVVFDTGFSRDAGLRRGRVLERTPAEAVAGLGLDPASVRQVVLSHLHYDHAGNLDDFPEAEVVVQGAELRYATGWAMRHAELNHFFEADDVNAVVRALFGRRVTLVEGYRELAPGVELHLVGGHTRGLQVLRVHTDTGWLVLAADALHYDANLDERNPFPAFVDLGDVLDSYDTVLGLAGSRTRVIPGHDPQIFDRYPRAGADPDTVALHGGPRRTTGGSA